MKRILLSIFSVSACMGAFAIPAKTGFINFTQPDGEVIQVKMIGDEHGHLIYSLGGHLLIDNEGSLEYAKFNAEGLPVPSGLRVMSEEISNSIAAQLQTRAQIDAWAEKIALNKSVRLESLWKVTEDPDAEEGEDKESGESDDNPGDDENENPEVEDPESDINRLVPLNFGRFESGFPAFGEQKGLVVLVEYSDVSFTYGDYDYFHRMLNEEGFSDNGSLGSARDFFINNSNGLFLPDFDVYGPVVLPRKRSYYGKNDVWGNDQHPEEMAIDALDLLDEEVDFSQYDRDGDGCIDNVFIFYAGKGEHDTGITNLVWPHAWEVSASGKTPEYDGVILDRYACTCEYASGYKRPDGIGTFVHEFSHVMGLPDLYATSYSSSFTPGRFSAMDAGPYNNDGLTPPNYSSFEKCALGWIEFLPFEDGHIELPYLADSNVAYALPTPKTNEFFFFENRQQLGNDEFIPGHGMIVWHVDYRKKIWESNSVNNTPAHQYVDLVEADNHAKENSRDGDPFPGTKNVTQFGYDTTPKLCSWQKKRLSFDLTNIQESEDGLISFDVVGSSEIPGDPGAVSVVDTENVNAGNIYDLMGRRVTNPGKGIYVVDGKKVVF